MKDADTQIISILTDIKNTGGGGGGGGSSIPTSALDTDGTLAANSDAKVPSQKAVKTYVNANAGVGYLVYAANLSQSGTDAPVATVLQNTTGATLTWNYNGPGSYYAGASLPIFVTGKTASFNVLGSLASHSGFEDLIFIAGDRIDNDNFGISVFNNNSGANDVLNSTFIEIRVYP